MIPATDGSVADGACASPCRKSLLHCRNFRFIPTPFQQECACRPGIVPAPRPGSSRGARLWKPTHRSADENPFPPSDLPAGDPAGWRFVRHSGHRGHRARDTAARGSRRPGGEIHPAAGSRAGGCRQGAAGYQRRVQSRLPKGPRGRGRRRRGRSQGAGRGQRPQGARQGSRRQGAAGRPGRACAGAGRHACRRQGADGGTPPLPRRRPARRAAGAGRIAGAGPRRPGWRPLPRAARRSRPWSNNCSATPH
jgi:hypothetical protein